MSAPRLPRNNPYPKHISVSEIAVGLALMLLIVLGVLL